MSETTTHSTLVALCTALAFAAAFLVAAAWLLLRFLLGEAAASTLPPPYPGVFAAVAAAALVAAPLAEGRLMRGGGDRERAYVRAKVVGFALRLMVAVNGFLLALGTGRIAWSLALSTAALVAMALAWPRASDLGASR